MPAAAPALRMRWPASRDGSDQASRSAVGGRERAQSSRAERAAAGMAKGRVALRGRSMVALVLVAFVLLASLVIWRRSAGIAGARELRELGQTKLQLEGDRARLARDIRAASSRERLMPVAEQRLGMRVPWDGQMIILERRAVGDTTP